MRQSRQGNTVSLDVADSATDNGATDWAAFLIARDPDTCVQQRLYVPQKDEQIVKRMAIPVLSCRRSTRSPYDEKDSHGRVLVSDHHNIPRAPLNSDRTESCCVGRSKSCEADGPTRLGPPPRRLGPVEGDSDRERLHQECGPSNVGLPRGLRFEQAEQ